MQIPPTYHVTPEMLNIIAKIDTNRELIAAMNPPVSIVEKIHRTSLLKSSLFSARIEGHTANFEDLDSKKKEQIEIFNILRAITDIKRQVKPDSKLTKTLLSKIHALVMNGIQGSAGKFRRETTAIFNQAGIAVYLPPPPIKIGVYLDELLAYANGKQEQFVLVQGFMTHLIFEKIHPFLDGNGRVGRLLIYALLQSKGYDFGIHIPFEEYLDNHKEDYYYYLDVGLSQPNEYIQFMLSGYLHQTDHIKQQLTAEHESEELLLPLRQQEILNIIKDHATVSLNFITRRFMKVPERTLRYDLKKLVEKGCVVKIGKTRGVFYSVKK